MPSDAVIDPSKLPRRALIDSGVLIRALGQRQQEAASALCRDFWQEMLKARNDILIAAPTVTEVTRHTKNHAPVQVPPVPGVTVVAFDQSAALLLAKVWPEQVIRNEQQSSGLFLDYLRYDALILACALRYGAVLVTLEAQLSKLAGTGGVTCKTVTDFEYSQRSLFPPPGPTGSGAS